MVVCMIFFSVQYLKKYLLTILSGNLCIFIIGGFFFTTLLVLHCLSDPFFSNLVVHVTCCSDNKFYFCLSGPDEQKENF